MDGKKQNSVTIIRNFAEPEKVRYIFSIILAVGGIACGFIPYFAVSKIIINLVEGVLDVSTYQKLCFIAVIGYILKVILTNISTGISHTATFITLKDIRKKLISKLSKMPMGKILDTPSGQFKDIIVDRVEALEIPLAHLLPEMTANILTPIFILIFLGTISWPMALISLITLPIGFVFMMKVMKTYPSKYEGSLKAVKTMNSNIVEYVNGIEVIKTFNQRSNSYKKYTDSVVDNAAYFYNWMKSCQLFISINNTIAPATLITVLPIGFMLYINNLLAASEFITIIILSLGLIEPILAAVGFTDSLAMVGTVVNEIDSILNGEELIRPKTSNVIEDLTIKLKNVTFKYDDESKAAIKDLNITINPKTVTALVGASGSGKSTIAKLIAGFFDVSDGELMIGNTNLKNISQKELCENISYVSQDNYLFDDTIRENIRIGNSNATDKEVEDIARKAGCHMFISKLQDGYETMVGGAGGHLSGGERQRITIARAMLKNAPIVILDEATAYTDPENEAVIQKSVSKLVASKTLIVIAHRLSTITDSDQIIVMEKGRAQAQGTHEELLENCNLYKNMWNAHIGAKDSDIND